MNYFLLMSGICLGLILPNAYAVNWDEWDNSVIRLMVKLDKGISTGTAFAINDQGDYITNYHVIKDALVGQALFAVESLAPVKKRHKATVIWADEDVDLAMVRVEGWKQKPLVLGDIERLEKKQALVTIGFPGASDFGRLDASFTVPRVKSGVLSAITLFILREGGAVKVNTIEHDAALNSGNSGGPLADECGRVVGVNVIKASSKMSQEDVVTAVAGGVVGINTTEGIFLSIGVDELRRQLDKRGVNYSQDSRVCVPETSQMSQLSYLMMGLLLLLSLVMWVFYVKLRKFAGTNPLNMRMASQLIQQAFSPDVADEKVDKMAREKPRRDPETGEVILQSVKQSSPPKVAIALVAIQGNFADISIYQAGRYNLGYASDNDIVVNNDYVSGQHLELEVVSNDKIWVTDKDSTNGTQIQGKGLPAGVKVSLQLGQVLQLGHAQVQFRLDIAR